jgi:hypothetical protein
MLGIGGVNGFGSGVPKAARKTTPEQDLEQGVRYISFFLFACYLIRLWYVLDPQPGPLTDAVTGVSQERVDGYGLVLAVFLFGLFMIIRFLVKPVLKALEPAPAIARVLAWLILGLIVAAIATGFLAQLTGIAVLAAMGLNWVLETAAPREEAPNPPRGSDVRPFPPIARPE